MANHETRRGSWGKLPPAKMQPDGHFLATGRYKTMDGKPIQRARRGSTARKAEDTLRKLFQKMRDDEKAAKKAAKKAAMKKKRPGSEVPFAQFVEDWISYIEAGGKGMRPSTIYEYARIARADIIPALGTLPLFAIDIQTCADYLHGIVKDRFGSGSIGLGIAGLVAEPDWSMKRKALSRRYTTEWAELPVVKAC